VSPRADSQVARSRLSVCCFYMFLRFDSHENRGVDLFARLPFERGDISPSRAHMNTLSGKLCHNACFIFTPFVSSRTRRGSSMYLQTPFCKTSTFKTSYFNRIVHLWNLILKFAPSCIFATLSSFKTFLYKTYKELLTTTFDPDLPCTYSLCRTCPCHS
jgi:hypothetical protein